MKKTGFVMLWVLGLMLALPGMAHATNYYLDHGDSQLCQTTGDDNFYIDCEYSFGRVVFRVNNDYSGNQTIDWTLCTSSGGNCTPPGSIPGGDWDYVEKNPANPSGSWRLKITGTTGQWIRVTAYRFYPELEISPQPMNFSMTLGGNPGTMRLDIENDGDSECDLGPWTATRSGSYIRINGGTSASGSGEDDVTISLTNYSGLGVGNHNLGKITVTASGAQYSPQEATVYLNITCNPPVITQHPQPKTECEGGSVTFSVTAAGDGLNYQWYKDGSTPVGTNSNQYIIPSVSTSHAGSYHCVVTGTCAPPAASNSATLTVNTAPVITLQPQSQTVDEGNPVTFDVLAAGSAPLDYQWRKDSNDILGANDPNYTIDPVTANDAGNYTCVVSNSCDSVESNPATLMVNTAPVIISHPNSQVVDEGDMVEFCVSVTGAEPFSYQWRKDGNDIVDGDTNDSCYTISKVNMCDAGSYDCVVSNSLGSVDSNDAILAVEAAFIPGDIDGDGEVGFEDFAILAACWSETNCGFCEGANLNCDGSVDWLDVRILSEHWLDIELIKIHGFYFDTDPNWPVEGEWAFGQPTGGGGAHGYPDPNAGYTGANVYGVDLNGDYETTVGGPYHLTVGPLNCAGYQRIHLRFVRWLNTDVPIYVASKIEASNNGTDWNVVWEHTGSSEITDEAWQLLQYDIGDIADNKETVYIRWSYEILDDRAYPYSGWNIDDIELWGSPLNLPEFNLDADPNWSTEGEWAFGQPTGGGGAHGYPDPCSGYDGNTVYGVNLNGDYSTSVGGPYYLTSVPIDCSDYHNIRLRFARWLNTDAPIYVASKVEVSNNGADWNVVWEHTGTSDITDGGWQIVEYDMNSIADNQSTVYLRWSYQILDSRAYQYSGWNIDEVKILGDP